MGGLRRRARSSPFDTLFAPVKCNFCALSDAPIRRANGHDLQPFLESAAPRSGVSDLVTLMRFLRSFLDSLKFIKLIESRARRTSPQGHGRSLPDAVKSIDFASLLEGFWPNPSNRLRPRRAFLRLCKNSNMRYCSSI